MTFMTELLNLVDGNAMEVGHFPTFTSSQTRNSPIDNNLQNFARNLLPTHFASRNCGRELDFGQSPSQKSPLGFLPGQR